jgi:hypothetical protein
MLKHVFLMLYLYQTTFVHYYYNSQILFHNLLTKFDPLFTSIRSIRLPNYYPPGHAAIATVRPICTRIAFHNFGFCCKQVCFVLGIENIVVQTPENTKCLQSSAACWVRQNHEFGEMT